MYYIGQAQWNDGEGYERPHVLVTSPGSPERPRPTPPMAPSVGGRIQVRLGFDATTLQLLVTIVCAAGIIPRSPHQPRNPYCKLFLLPDRSEKSKRRTRTLAGEIIFTIFFVLLRIVALYLQSNHNVIMIHILVYKISRVHSQHYGSRGDCIKFNHIHYLIMIQFSCDC